MAKNGQIVLKVLKMILMMRLKVQDLLAGKQSESSEDDEGNSYDAFRGAQLSGIPGTKRNEITEDQLEPYRRCQSEGSECYSNAGH